MRQLRKRQAEIGTSHGNMTYSLVSLTTVLMTATHYTSTEKWNYFMFQKWMASLQETFIT
jgi:hypothetical protein